MKDKLTVLAGDVLLTVLILVVVSLLYPQELSSAAKSVLALAMFVLTFTANLYVFELYDLTPQNGVRTVFRLALAYIVSTVFLSMWFSLFTWFGGHRNAFALAGSPLLGAMYVCLRGFAHTRPVFVTNERRLFV